MLVGGVSEGRGAKGHGFEALEKSENPTLPACAAASGCAAERVPAPARRRLGLHSARRRAGRTRPVLLVVLWRSMMKSTPPPKPPPTSVAWLAAAAAAAAVEMAGVGLLRRPRLLLQRGEQLEAAGDGAHPLGAGAKAHGVSRPAVRALDRHDDPGARSVAGLDRRLDLRHGDGPAVDGDDGVEARQPGQRGRPAGQHLRAGGVRSASGSWWVWWRTGSGLTPQRSGRPPASIRLSFWTRWEVLRCPVCSFELFAMLRRFRFDGEKTKVGQYVVSTNNIPRQPKS